MRSDQLSSRPLLVELLQKFAKHQGYSQATLHLGTVERSSALEWFFFQFLLSFAGVYILDIYMDAYILSDNAEHQKLIALVSLLLAAKSEDLDENVPSIKDLLKVVDMSEDLGCDLRFRSELEPKVVNQAFKKFAEMYCKIEFLIFESISFNAIRPTAVNFINIYQNIVVTSVDLKNEEGATLGDLLVSANEYIKQFLDFIVIQDIEFFNILPSKLAAAIIGATRKLIKIETYWNEELTNLTRYKIEDIRPLMIRLLDKRFNVIYERDIVMKDSGYLSPSSLSETDDELKNPYKKRKLMDRAPIVYGVL